ncbi:hypothetical protein ACFL2C_02215 [Patescibacteria group bacterium]
MKKKKLWFRARDYGWGWRPNTWQGWSVIGIYLGFVLFSVLRLPKDNEPTRAELIEFFVPFVVVTVVLVGISHAKGEKPEWRWRGKPLKKS